MQFKYNTDQVIQALEFYLQENKVRPDEFNIEREDMYRNYETLVRLANPPSSVLLDDYELELLYKYL